MLDSTAKFPDGAIDFHIVLLGSIEECIDIEVPSQQIGDESMPGFSGKYLYVGFFTTERSNERGIVVIPDIGDSLGGIAQVLSQTYLGTYDFTNVNFFVGIWYFIKR